MVERFKTKTIVLNKLKNKKQKLNFDKEIKNAIVKGDKYLSSLDENKELNEKETEVATKHYALKISYEQKLHSSDKEMKIAMLGIAIDLINFYKNNTGGIK